MDSKRQQKFNRLLQRDLGEIIHKESPFMFSGGIVGVAEVKITPDLGQAKIYLSIMGTDPKNVLAAINENNSKLRNLLAKRIKNQVRKIPELLFYYDDLEGKAAEMEFILQKLDIPEAKDDEEMNQNYKSLD